MPTEKISTVLTAASEIRDKRISLSEKTLSYVSELAEVLVDEAGDDEIFFRDEAFIRRYRSLTEPKKEDNVAPFNDTDVKTVEKQLNEAEKALLCLRLADILGIKGIEGSGTFFDDPPKTTGETVCYVKNRLSDDAYLTFAPQMNDPRVSYAHDFGEVAQSVMYGKTAYGILPVSNAKALSLKLGLKIVNLISVKGQDGAISTLALVKKDLNIPQDAENTYFEFVIKNINGIGALLIASEACGIEPTELNYSKSDKTLNAVVRISENGFCGFLTYLSLNYPDFITVGIYKEI